MEPTTANPTAGLNGRSRAPSPGQPPGPVDPSTATPEAPAELTPASLALLAAAAAFYGEAPVSEASMRLRARCRGAEVVVARAVEGASPGDVARWLVHALSATVAGLEGRVVEVAHAAARVLEAHDADPCLDHGELCRSASDRADLRDHPVVAAVATLLDMERQGHTAPPPHFVAADLVEDLALHLSPEELRGFARAVAEASPPGRGDLGARDGRGPDRWRCRWGLEEVVEELLELHPEDEPLDPIDAVELRRSAAVGGADLVLSQRLARAIGPADEERPLRLEAARLAVLRGAEVAFDVIPAPVGGWALPRQILRVAREAIVSGAAGPDRPRLEGLLEGLAGGLRLSRAAGDLATAGLAGEAVERLLDSDRSPLEVRKAAAELVRDIGHLLEDPGARRAAVAAVCDAIESELGRGAAPPTAWPEPPAAPASPPADRPAGGEAYRTAGEQPAGPAAPRPPRWLVDVRLVLDRTGRVRVAVDGRRVELGAPGSATAASALRELARRVEAAPVEAQIEALAGEGDGQGEQTDGGASWRRASA
jgi:hypothetical protein